MFAGFNLTLNSMDLIELSAYKEQGDQLFKEQKKEIVAALEKYINVDGSLEASKIESFVSYLMERRKLLIVQKMKIDQECQKKQYKNICILN